MSVFGVRYAPEFYTLNLTTRLLRLLQVVLLHANESNQDIRLLPVWLIQ